MKPIDCLSWLLALCALYIASGLAFANTSHGATSTPQIISSLTDGRTERSIVHVRGDIYRVNSNNHSGLLMLTDEGAVLVDPLNVGNAEWVKGEVETQFDTKVSHVLYSHGHQDHASGAAFFEGAEVISHKSTFDLLTPAADQPLTGRYLSSDRNGDGYLDASEWRNDFSALDADGDGKVTGQEAYIYNYRNVVEPTQTYEGGVHRFELGGKVVEMHHLGGNHAPDMSYILFPEESVLFVVDVISLKTLPWSTIPWYAKDDNQNTFDAALSIDAEVVVPGHGAIGTRNDISALQQYMAELREGVIAGMDAGLTLEQIQATLLLEDYSDWEFYADRRPDNIAGIHSAILRERAN